MNKGFTTRAAIVATGLSIFLLVSSSYIALKLGALPWPIVFSVIVAGSIIKLLNRSKPVNIHEVNVAQAGASIGGLVAAGVVFTLPGIFWLNSSQGLAIPWPNPWLLGLVVSLAGVLGVLLSVPLKLTFVDRENLPYPAGTAGAEVLKLGKTGGRQLLLILLVGCLAAVFALYRDIAFPAGYTLASLAAAGIFLTLYPMPLAIGGGYILGPKASWSWLLGAVIGWLGVIPWLLQHGFDRDGATGFVQNAGMGMVLGTGVGFFLTYIIPRLKVIFAPLFRAPENFLRLFPLVALVAVVVLALAGVPWLAAVLCVAGVMVMVAVAGRMTGETNINPLEQFGIFVGILIALLYAAFSLELGMYALFMIVTFVSVAAAVAGDAGHDFKSAALVGTHFMDIVKVDLIAAIAAGVCAPIVLETIRYGFADQLFTPAMPAPQAKLVAGSISGFSHPMAFAGGFVFALVAEIINRFLPEKFRNRILLMPLGIGMFLGFGLALPIALGALLRAWVDRKRPGAYHQGLLIAAGIMGGEGVAGFSAGALTTSGLPFRTGAIALMVLFMLLLIVALFLLLYSSRRSR